MALAVVKLPVDATLAPIGKLSAYPPVTRALPELKFVATNVVTFASVVF